MRQRGLLDRRSKHLLLASCWTVWLRKHQRNFMASRQNSLKRGNGKLGSTAKDESHSL